MGKAREFKACCAHAAHDERGASAVSGIWRVGQQAHTRHIRRRLETSTYPHMITAGVCPPQLTSPQTGRRMRTRRDTQLQLHIPSMLRHREDTVVWAMPPVGEFFTRPPSSPYAMLGVAVGTSPPAAFSNEPTGRCGVCCEPHDGRMIGRECASSPAWCPGLAAVQVGLLARVANGFRGCR